MKNNSRHEAATRHYIAGPPRLIIAERVPGSREPRLGSAALAAAAPPPPQFDSFVAHVINLNSGSEREGDGRVGVGWGGEGSLKMSGVNKEGE